VKEKLLHALHHNVTKHTWIEKSTRYLLITTQSCWRSTTQSGTWCGMFQRAKTPRRMEYFLRTRKP